MTDRTALVRLAMEVADDLDARAQPGLAGLLRQLAGAVLRPVDPAPGDRCACGRPILQPVTGRRRRWCSTCRPSRAKPRETSP